MDRLLWKTADRVAIWWELKFGSDITIQILALPHSLANICQKYHQHHQIIGRMKA